jgi:hypothetical protein
MTNDEIKLLKVEGALGGKHPLVLYDGGCPYREDTCTHISYKHLFCSVEHPPREKYFFSCEHHLSEYLSMGWKEVE